MTVDKAVNKIICAFSIVCLATVPTATAAKAVRGDNTDVLIVPSADIITPPQSYAEDGDTLVWLARAAELSAGGRSFPTRVAVCAVLLNRLGNDAFPDTIGEIILQFLSSHGIADLAAAMPDERSMRAASAALRGGDPTRGALYFADADLVPPDIRDGGRILFEYDGMAFWH